jgi:hypothetical protein
MIEWFKTVRALLKLHKAMNYVSYCRWDSRALNELSKHHNALSRMDCEFWHIQFEPFGYSDPKLPPDMFDYDALEGRDTRSWEEATSMHRAYQESCVRGHSEARFGLGETHDHTERPD